MATIMEKFSLGGRTALVTGGAGLLGRQFTLALGEAGAKVVVADLDAEAAQAHAQTLMATGITALAVGVDVTDVESVSEMVQRTVAEFGSLDVIVNSAALDPKFDLEHKDDQKENEFEKYNLFSWQKILNVNLTGVFLSSQAAAKEMVKQNSGVIINICSIYGLLGPDQSIYPETETGKSYKPVAYSVTKAGILGFTKYLAAYYANTGIRVNALSPGGVYNKHDIMFTRNFSAKVIMGRMAEIDELNGAILFLASDASKYMTGSNLIIDGGYTAW